jgi:pimeloyl-ACP methyl ester carboxylesterase
VRILKRVAVVLLALCALFALDRRFRAAPRLTAEWLQAGDVQVRAVRAGSGDTTIVFIHGYSESLLSWRGQFDGLSHRFKVVALDVPGFGVSDKPAGPYTLRAQTTRLADFLDRWTTGPLILAGHSMGGELAMDLALRRPRRVVGLVLVSPAGYGLAGRLDSMAPGTVGLISWAGAAATTGILPVHDAQWLEEPRERAEYLPATDPAYRHALEAVLDSFDFTGLRDSIANVRQPTLLIWGRLDPTIPFAIGVEIAARLPCRQFKPLDATLHRPMQTDPDTVTALMLAFFQDPRCEH